jgi:hypothetical protein
VTISTNGGFGQRHGDLRHRDGRYCGPVIGDPTQSADTGDRTLAASGNGDLCFNVTPPRPEAAGLNTTATLAFQAEQTSSNP